MEIFERALERVRKSFALRVYGDVVMPDHVHRCSVHLSGER